MTFNVLVVANEKELNEVIPHVAAAKKYVGPIRIFKEHRAVEACEQAQEAARAGGLHASLLSNHFTAPGKHEFSDALRKVLREQFHDAPIVCIGQPKKGGDRGKHYHHACHEMEEIGPILGKIKSKELVAEWKEKGEKKGLFGRKSTDKPSPRPSMEAPPKKAPEPARKSAPIQEQEEPAPRRRSIDRYSDAAPALRRKSIDSQHDSKDLQSASMDMFGHNAGFSGMGGMRGMSGMSGMGGSGMMGGGMGGGMDPMMHGFGGMGVMGASGMMGGMHSLSGGANQVGMGNWGGMVGVAPTTVDAPAMMDGMNSFVNARPGGHMMPPPPPQPMHQRHSSAENVIQQFSSALHSQNMGGGIGMPGLGVQGAHNGMQQPPMGPSMGAPLPQFAGATDPAAMVAGMSMSDSSNNSNTALIRMLAEEVVWLRKALGAKEATRRASMDPNAAAASFTGAPRPFQMQGPL